MPATVTMRFFANIQLFMGKKEVRLVLDDSEKLTVGYLITEIARLEGKDLRNLVMDATGKSRATVRIVVNDELLLQDPFDFRVRNGDTVFIFPLLAGG